MFRTLVIVCCVALASAGVAKPSRVAGRIAGGEEADIIDYPYQASLETSGFHICGAAILSEDWALTAADCAGGQVNTYTLRAGSSVRGSGGSVHQVVSKIIHPENNGTVDYDLALLKVSNTTKFEFGDRVDKIALPEQDQSTADGAEATITGWGASSGDGIVTSIVLHVLRLPVVSEQACRDVYGDNVTPRVLCAGQEDSTDDSCQGDTGGPMVVDSQLVGVVSIRRTCAQAGRPGLYSRVSSMRDWIKSVTGI